jgi:hypothetical protein
MNDHYCIHAGEHNRPTLESLMELTRYDTVLAISEYALMHTGHHSPPINFVMRAID